MKKIVFTIGTLSSGGAERVLSILANRLAIEGYEVEIVTWKEAPVFYKFNANISIKSLPQLANSNDLLKQMWVLRKYIRKSNPDLCVSFLAPFNIVTLFALLGLKQKVVVAERNDPRYVPFSPFMRLLRNLIYHTATSILTQTENNKNYFSQKLQCKTTVIYNPTFLSENLLNKALTVPKSNKIVCVSRLVKQKNLIMLLDAFNHFVLKNPTYKLIIYGEGNQREELEAKIRELNLKNKVELPGATKNVHMLLLDAKMFVLPSNFEGMPNALIEAMCLGLPCISTKVSGAVDLIENGKNGLLIDVGSSEQMVQAMNQIVSDDEFANEIANNACHLYEKLNVDIIYEQWKNYIDSKLKN